MAARDPIVSVLMTAYNREKYIREAIQSVLESSFADFELIIVDDASTDTTLEIAREYERKDKRVIAHTNEENHGDYPNRNRAAAFARGRYLKYVDSDDIIYPHGLETMVAAMERFPEVGLGLCKPPLPDHPFPYCYSPEESYREHFLGSGLFGNAPLSAIIRRCAFGAVGGFSGKRYVGDAELWLRIAARFPVVALVQGLTWWRCHGAQELDDGLRSGAYDRLNYEISIDALGDINCPLNHQDRERAVSSIKQHQAKLILRSAIRRLDVRRATALWRDSEMSTLETLKCLVKSLGQRCAL